MKKSRHPQNLKGKISDSTVRRLSLYLRYLQEASARGEDTISSEELALRGGTTSAQVRKDFSVFGSFGKRGMGYSVTELLRSLEEILGLHRRWRVGLVGAGKIGSALFSYRNFQTRGFDIRAVFDSDPGKVGKRWEGVEIRAQESLEEVLVAEGIEIVVIAVPAEVAQQVVDRVVRAGIRAILNFAPVRLRVPEEISLRNVDMVVEMEGLTFALHNQ
jgi:redox-sensing transcriptional repressor